MKISRHDKLLLFEQEFLALVIVIILGFVFYWLKQESLFYLITLLIGFLLYFWMIYEEKIHRDHKKHDYFEHTSSYIILGQTGIALSLLFNYLRIDFLVIITLLISVIMYSVSLSRIILYKMVFR
ncbi:hypothetical protein JW756_03120 [Candidatus Woesearchaeota archaeon]|nr:hypothetical protein [Candidatus Woesearchaeota archaeon]